MREILFRGKKAVDNEWVEGYYFKTQIGEKEVRCITPFDKFVDRCIYQLIPETVGQFTGLTDKNGTRIFEGDIVKCYFNDSHKIGYVEWQNDDCRYLIDTGHEWISMDYCSCEVIGNIHDNPELIGGAENV